MVFAYLPLVFVALAILAGTLLVTRRQRTHITSAAALRGVTQAVDITAFCNLVDPEEDAFLRANLPPPEYRELRRERLLTAALYVRRVSANAAVLITLGDAVRRSPEPGIARAGEQMVSDAIRLRLYAAVVLLNLWAAVALPKAKIPSAALVSRYQHLKELATHLGRLQNPPAAAGVSVAL